MSEDDGAKGISQFASKAKTYLNDKEKTSELLKKAVQKAGSSKGPLEKIWDKLQLLFNLLKDYLSGEYRQIPTGSVIMIVAAILYFVSPVDLVPDFIPIAGLVDDAAVIGFVFAQIGSDLEKYRVWKESCRHSEDDGV